MTVQEKLKRTFTRARRQNLEPAVRNGRRIHRNPGVRMVDRTGRKPEAGNVEAQILRFASKNLQRRLLVAQRAGAPNQRSKKRQGGLAMTLNGLVEKK